MPAVQVNLPSSRGRGLALACALLVSACGRGTSDGVDAASPPASAAPMPLASAAPGGSSAPQATASPSASAAEPLALADAGAPLDAGARDDDPMALHVETREELLSLFSIGPVSAAKRRKIDPEAFLAKAFGVGSPALMHQGNKAIARHERSKAKCLEGLRDVVIQTEEQKRVCGADYMVPVYRHGDPSKAKFCIDEFEFPNKPCELPMVWTAPVLAAQVCELQGKRLCAQEEWTLACRGDPEGGPDRVYAYGDEMDLSICNTDKHPRPDAPECDPKSAVSAYRTCATDTEPSGSFPQCRSRFGVFDQHGNVAEAMTRLDADGHVYSQLKGSAFFYWSVARKPNQRAKKGERETYPDHCAYDPRWHVEPIESAYHVNYHLGFRCCKTLRP